jgi:6-methylsalicylate decarboxylase
LYFPDQIHEILRLVGKDRLFYESDFPFMPHKGVESLAGRMKVGMEEILNE